MRKMNVTSKEILEAIPGEHLIQLGILKLLENGESRYEIHDMVEIWAWKIYQSLQEEKRNGTIQDGTGPISGPEKSTATE